MKKILLGALFVLLGSNLNAGCISTGCTSVNVDRFLVASSGSILISTDGVVSALNCTASLGTYMTIPSAAIGKNSMYAFVLTAKTTNTPVSFAIVEGSTGCEIAFVY